MDKAASLVADLLAFIAMDDCTDDQFNQLALRLFAYQYECNAPFRSFCQRRGASLLAGHAEHCTEAHGDHDCDRAAGS